MRKTREFSAEYVSQPTHLEPVMPLNGEFAKWRNHLFWLCATVMVSGGVTWCTWVTLAVVARPDRDEITDMIVLNAPYTKDKGRIDQHLKAIDREMSELNIDRKELINVVTKNTEAIQALKLQIGLLQAVVERRIPMVDDQR